MIKKHFVLMMCVILMLATLAGCGNSKEEEGDSFIATVLENNETSLLVQPAEGSDELRSADKIVVYIEDVDFVDSQNNEITREDIEIGNQVEIFYSGGIAESYPAQIYGCYKVKLCNK